MNEKMAPSQSISYSSHFEPSLSGQKILSEGRILAPGEASNAMIERVVNTLFSVEKSFGIDKYETYRKANEFGSLLDAKDCVMSTPVMTNAGRFLDRPLSACTVPPVDLRDGLRNATQLINSFHEDGMGTGFNLDEADDPVGVLKFLNGVAVEGARNGNEDRPVGNMAIISVHHPRILDIISSKVGADDRGEEWKFNISVNASDEFMGAALTGAQYHLQNGELINSHAVLREIVEAANLCGDPGLIFMDRVNRDNPTPIVGEYVSTAPCAEVGLAPGESCQFGYINLGNFVSGAGLDMDVDYQRLEYATRLMTRALDNALEYSLDKFAHPTNKSVMQSKRKIGVGVCGLADLFVKIGIPYDSEKGAKLAREVVGFINYFSKVESVEMAQKRGSFGAMQFVIGNRYREIPGFLETKYGNLDTSVVTGEDWTRLGERIRKTGLLRNASTVALPPTGRSGLVIDASTGVEPLFSLVDYSGNVNPALVKHLKRNGYFSEQVLAQILRTGQLSHVDGIPESIKSIYKTALEIQPEGHLSMVARIQEAVDESISKTINVPSETSSDEIRAIYMDAYQKGLKGITIFRTGSRLVQPRSLALQ